MILSWKLWSVIWALSLTLGALSAKELREGRQSSCDVIFSSDTTKTGFVTSPNYPNSYPAKSKCRYDFQGRKNEKIQIIFQDFDLYQSADNTKKCESTDSLVAYVLIDGKMEEINSFCGEGQPRPLMSNGPRLLLEFRGFKSSRHAQGFKATYSFTENFGITMGKQVTSESCAFSFYSNETINGTFISPNYPGFYPRNTECHYLFYGHPKERIQLHFYYFDIEGVLPCDATSASDYVDFSNYLSRDRKYSRHCGQLQEFDVESDRSFFRVTFKSNDRLDGTGFNASYIFINEEENYMLKTPPNTAFKCCYSLVQVLVLLLIIQAYGS